MNAANDTSEPTMQNSGWKLYAGHFMTRAETKIDEIRIYVFGEIWAPGDKSYGIDPVGPETSFRMRWEVEVQDMDPAHGSFFCKRVVEIRTASFDDAKLEFSQRTTAAANIMMGAARSVRESG